MLDSTPVFDPTKLRSAIERASQNLRDLLQNPLINLVLIEDNHPETQRKYLKRWMNEGGSNWNIHFNELPNKPENLIIAIYSADVLCGLCLYDIRGIAIESERLTIHTIERNKAHKHLEGHLISSFSQAGLEIAQALNILRLSILNAGNNTIPTYLRLGFSNANGRENLTLEVDSNTQLNWNAQKEHVQQRQLRAA